MEKFRELIARLSSIKRTALLSFFCLLVQVAFFCSGLIISYYVIKPTPPRMFDENEGNSFILFMFLIVPLILFFSAVASFFSIFSTIAPNGSRRRTLISASIVGLIQIVSFFFSVFLAFVVLIYGFHFIFAVVPIFLLLIISVIVGNHLALKTFK